MALWILLAATHFALVRSGPLNPWLGGGFGMFSTVDERHLVVTRVVDGRSEPLPVPPELEDAADRARALPSAARLRAFAEDLAAAVPAEALRVEVFAVRFERDMRPVPHRLRAVVVDGTAGPH